VVFAIVTICNGVKPYYTPVDRFVRKSCGADFKVQGNFKLDDVVGPGICTKQGFEGQPGQETTQYQVDAVRKIGCSSLLPGVDVSLFWVYHLTWIDAQLSRFLMTDVS
jgi:hypothetical protein